MSLKNPINFFRMSETDALKKKALTVPENIATTSVTFVDKPDNTTKDSIAANDATGDGAIFIEGKKVIQGVSVAEKQLLLDQLGEKERAKYSAAYVSVNKDTEFEDFMCSRNALTFKFDALYDGVGTTKVTKATVNDVTPTKTPEAGRYIADVELPASTTGYQTVTAKFSFTNNDTGYGPVTCEASKTISHQVKSVIISIEKGVTPSSISISGATNKVVGIKGEHSFTTTAGKDMWICTPSCDTYNKITSDGFVVPFDDAIQVPVNGINYNCRRKSDTPTDKTGTMTIVIA